ncbi:cytoskeletal protein RodZ [Novosphingobium sp. 1748]|nr:cytoskeletal protein RodZ [Novosphingobium sp. 1748]
MHEHIFAAVFTLDEAKTLLSVEELHDALALANDLGRHAATAAAARAAEAAATAAAKAAATRAAAEAATITAAEAAAITAAAKAVTAAETVATTKAVATAHEGIETFFAEPVALVSAPAATPSIKTHKTESTFASP